MNVKTTAPLGLVPSWSTDTNLDDTGKTWDGTPTRVDPGAGKREDGWKPNEQPMAQHLNQLLGELGDWIQYWATAQIQNWMTPVSLPSTSYVEPTLLYDRKNALWLCSTTTGKILSSPDGVQWTSHTLVGPGEPLTWGVQLPPACTYGTIWGGTTGVLWLYGTGTTVQTVTLPAVGGHTVGAYGGFYDATLDLIIVYGIDTTDSSPQAWYATPAAPTVFTRVALTGGTSTTGVVCGTSDGLGHISLMANNGDTSTDVWHSSNGTSYTHGSVITLDAKAIKNIAYNPERALWLAFEDDGYGWASTDGVTWAHTAAYNIDTTGLKANTLIGVGRFWLILGPYPYAFFAGNDVSLWRRIAVSGLNATAFGKPCYSAPMRRFGVCSWSGSAAQEVRLSLSLGTVLYACDGTEVTPTSVE